HPLSGPSVEEALEEYIQIHDVDILVMYAPQHHWLRRIFRKSYTKSMALETHVPLLILKK
nr:universal stress protein [Saprospiraceae bacterium]